MQLHLVTKIRTELKGEIIKVQEMTVTSTNLESIDPERRAEKM